MPARMNDFDRAPDREWQTYGKERRFGLGIAAVIRPATTPVAPWTSKLGMDIAAATFAATNRSGARKALPARRIAEFPSPLASQSPDHSPPVSLLGRIA